MSTKVKRYRELHQVDWTPNWVFRKYSSVKRKEFVASTGFPAEDKLAAQAYKAGLDKFNDWLGVYLPSGRQLLIKDLGRAVLATKKSKKGGERGASYRSAKNQIENHIIPAFGHLRPDQMTSLKWETYDSEERAKPRKSKKGKVLPPRKALANTRKFLVEIMLRALDEGLIKRVPDFKMNDPEADPPKYLNRKQARAFFHAATGNTKLLSYVMWKQGPRPSEACRYRFSMIDFPDIDFRVPRKKRPKAQITIPGEITKNGKTRVIYLNSRVERVLRRLKATTTRDCVFPTRWEIDTPIQEYDDGFTEAFSKAKLTGFIPYNFRDTAITNMLKRGLSSTFIAKYVQNSAAIIDKRYAVSEEEIMREVAG